MSTFDELKHDILGEPTDPLDREPVHDRLTVPPLSEQEASLWDDPRAVFGFCGPCKEHSVLVFDEDGEPVGSECCGAKLIPYDEDPT